LRASPALARLLFAMNCSGAATTPSMADRELVSDGIRRRPIRPVVGELNNRKRLAGTIPNSELRYIQFVKYRVEWIRPGVPPSSGEEEPDRVCSADHRRGRRCRRCARVESDDQRA
jgi:hypothetical protein